MNPRSRLFCSDCWNRMRNTSSPMATISRPKRTLARRISFRARNISDTVRNQPPAKARQRPETTTTRSPPDARERRLDGGTSERPASSFGHRHGLAAGRRTAVRTRCGGRYVVPPLAANGAERREYGQAAGRGLVDRRALAASATVRRRRYSLLARADLLRSRRWSVGNVCPAHRALLGLIQGHGRDLRRGSTPALRTVRQRRPAEPTAQVMWLATRVSMPRSSEYL